MDLNRKRKNKEKKKRKKAPVFSLKNLANEHKYLCKKWHICSFSWLLLEVIARMYSMKKLCCKFSSDLQENTGGEDCFLIKFQAVGDCFFSLLILI